MLPDYELTDTLASDETFELRRGRRMRTGAPVLVKLTRAGAARPADAAALRRECALALELASAATLLPRVVETHTGSALVMEDPGGELLPVARRAGRAPFDVIANVGAQLADALAELHARGIVHRGLRPEVVLCDPTLVRAWLVDLGEARALSGAVHDAAAHAAARLVYAAPEQSGRMDRTSDQRSDLYSLGVLLYECLCGTPPFAADDALELIHRHIAAAPLEPHRHDPAIPEPLSAVVMRLLAKSPDERYQTARGVAEDLRHCAREWQRHGRIDAFVLGRRDANGQLAMSRRLYGREAEVQQLLGAFERSCAGAHAGELVLVEGYAGIGKTALIQQLYRPIVRRRGYFISGKFDQVARGMPFGALIEAFRSLVQQLLTEPEAQLAEWRRNLNDALGGNGGVLAEVMPEIEFILGPQPVPVQLGSTEAHNRFQRVVQQFVDVLARPEHPLVLFLDDLQWADAATLALLHPLLAGDGRRCLLVLGACRDHEAEATPRLRRTLAALAADGVVAQRLALGPLQPHDLTAMVADTLRCDAAAAEPLARLVLAKTGGNPFFVTQFLKSLERDGLLRFDAEQARWTYRIAEIADAPLADNVIELMTRSIQRLSPKSQYALTLAACIGNRFDRRTLAIVSEQSAAQTSDDLAQALAEGLITPATPGSPSMAEAGAETAGEPAADTAYTFLHDRVQQAAYALIPPDRRRMVHLTVGRLLRSRTPAEQLDARRFEIVQHLNLGRSLITDRAERIGVATLNLEAGRKAKASTAHDSALELFGAGIELLDAQAWTDEHQLAFELHLDAAEARYLCGQFDDALADFERLLERPLTPIERARVIRLRSVQYENMARFADAIAATREGVAMFGVAFPDDEAGKLRALDAEIETIDRLRGTRSIASLEELPRMTDPQVRIVAAMLTDIWSSAYIIGDPTLARLISATLVRLSLEHGNVEESAYGYVTHAITVGAVRGDCAQAYEYGCLALAVNARFDDTRRRAKIYQQFHAHVNFWCRPFDSCAVYAREACRSGLESGDFLYAAYGAGTEPWAAMAATQDLARFEREHEPSIVLIERLKNRGFADSVRVLVNWSRALQGRTEGPLSLADASFDETAYLAAYRDNPFFTTIHAIARLHLTSLVGTPADALAAARHAAAYVHHVPGTVWPLIFDFWSAMAAAVAEPHAALAGRRDEVLAAQRRFEALAIHCEQNFGCQALLLGAEVARIEGRTDAAVAAYEQAVEFAHARPLLPFEALAHERCGRLFVETGRRALGRMHLAQARACYACWGARAKVEAMQWQYPVLSARSDRSARAEAPPGGEPEARGTAAHRGAGSELDDGLDLFSVVKAAQAIAAQTEVQGLLERLMRIAIENAGAQCGALVLESDEGPLVHAVDAPGAAAALEPVPLDRSACVPIGLVNYVRRTATHVVLAHAEADQQHGADPYFEAHRPRSVICVAAQHQGRLIGVLYLENRRVEGVFTAERVRVLQSLATQAAIALENARLRRELEAENSYLRRDLIANVSHDLRTPLVSIRGYLEVLASKGDSIDAAQRRSYLETAVRQSEHLGTLIDELFELAKLDFKGVALQRESFQLAELASDVLQKFRLIAQGKQISLDLEASHEMPAVDADVSLIERVFDNLIGNALKHTAPGGRVSLRLCAQGAGIQVSVIDNGAGIAAADLPHVFDRFYRAGAAAGAGLGLAITRRILELHGSTIEAHSDAGGTRFVFTLPCAVRSAAR